MVGSVLIALQASYRDGCGITSQGSLAPLGIDEEDQVEATITDGGEWSSGMVYFPATRLGTFADEAAPHEAFEIGVRKALLAAAAFLDRRSPEVISELRATGLSLRMFIDVRMDQDQMELVLPPEFVAACGRHRLGVFIISNDIPAAEVLKNDAAR